MKEQLSGAYLEQMKAQHDFHVLKAKRKAVIIGSDRKGNIGARIAQGLAGLGFSEIIELDLTDGDYSKQRVGLDHMYQADVIVLCNGHPRFDWLEDCPDEEIDKVIADSLTCSIKTTKEFVRSTIHDPWKKYVIMIGSMAYSSVLNGSAVYCAAKAGLAHYAKCAAWELAPKNYNVICVHPSNTEGTPMTEETIEGLMRYRNLTREQALAYWSSATPRKKMLQTEDISSFVNYFVSGSADYLSGGQINLTGGQR